MKKRVDEILIENVFINNNLLRTYFKIESVNNAYPLSSTHLRISSESAVLTEKNKEGLGGGGSQ